MLTQDRRVRRTQQLLAKALIALTLEKGYEAVSIRDITERADVGYATFFRHYRDKDTLLQDVLDVVLDEFIGLLGPTPPDTGPATIGTLLFRYVQQHNEMIRVLLGSHHLLQHLIETLTQKVASKHNTQADGLVPLEIAEYHTITASISLIQWWLEHQMPYPPERMGLIYHELIIHPTEMVAFSPQREKMCQDNTSPTRDDTSGERD